MPYLPQGATPAQRDAFAQRLARQLLSPGSRSSLMHVREAFARAGGFPDAHAAQAVIRQDNLWRNPLLAIGAAPSNIRPAYRFLGIHPDRLFDWARTAWRKHPQILSARPFSLEHAQMLLACLWGYPSWESVVEFEHKVPSKAKSHLGLSSAPTLEALRIEAGLNGLRDFKGLHIALGRTEKNEWVGLSMQRALTHALMLDEDRVRRYEAASRWLTHRINSDDAVCLVDASANNVITLNVQKAAQDAGRAVHVFDFTKDHIDARCLNMLSAGILTRLLYDLVEKPSDTDAHQNAIIGWICAVVLRWRGYQKTNELHSHVLARALMHAPSSIWWQKCVGLLHEDLAQAQAHYGALPIDWSSRVKSIEYLLTPHWREGDREPNISEQRNQIWVFRLPFLLSDGPDGNYRKRLLVATSFYKEYMANTMGRPLEEDCKWLIEGNCSNIRPLLNMHIDVPFNFYSMGESVEFAQSRSLGGSLVRIGPSSIIQTKGDGAAEILGNINTKVIHASSAPFVSFSGVQMPVIKDGMAAVLHGDQVCLVAPEWTA